MPSIYSFCEYSPDWPAAFLREAETLRALLGDALTEIHHIGSTSVPGLAAKPVIDLMPLTADIARIAACTGRMQAAGYRAWGEYGLPGRCLFTRDAGGVRTHNLHCYAADHADVARHLAFRDYLRAHDAVRDEYAEIKRQVYALHPADIAAYNDSKGAWVKQAEKRAQEWFRSRGGKCGGKCGEKCGGRQGDQYGKAR